MRESDEWLMKKAGKGDMDAFEELVGRYQKGAFNVAFKMLSDEHLAADLAQEAFLRILDKAEKYQPTAKFSTYFYSVLRRICIDHYRKKKPDSRPDFQSNEAENDLPADILIRKERDKTIHEAIFTLPARQRMALTLKHMQQMSYAEIAEVMDCSTGAVDSLLIRARKKLKNKLKGKL